MTLTHHNKPRKIIAPRNIEGGFSGSKHKGDNAPIIKSVFLCLSFSKAKLFRLSKIMTALSGQPFWLVVPLCDTANPLNAVTRFLAVLRDSFIQSKHKGITA